jgi:hypothetical protein
MSPSLDHRSHSSNSHHSSRSDMHQNRDRLNGLCELIHVKPTDTVTMKDPITEPPSLEINCVKPFFVPTYCSLVNGGVINASIRKEKSSLNSLGELIHVKITFDTMKSKIDFIASYSSAFMVMVGP